MSIADLDPFRTGGVIIWRGDALTFEFKYVSQEAEEILGYPTERWISEPSFWIDHIHPGDREWAPTFCAKATADREDHDFEYRMIAADGRVVWLRDIVRVALKDGEPHELYGVMVDITERRELLEQVATYTAVFDNTQVGLAVVRAHDLEDFRSLELLYANDAASTQIGGNLRPYLGQKLIEGFPALFDTEIPRQLLEVLLDGKPRNLGEIRYGDLTVQEGVYSLRAFPILNDRVGIAFENVTQAALEHEELERRVEERTRQLAESEEKYRVVVDTISDSVISIDGKSTILFANNATASMFGYPQHELIGRPLTDLMPENFRHLHEQAVARYQETGKPSVEGGRLEGSGLHKSGKEFPVSVGLGEGVHQGRRVFIGVIRDITERRRYEAELLQAREAALQSARIKSEFLANMSHEIRTPMNGVLGMTGLLLDTELTPQQSEFAETIRASAENLLVVINDILDFSKIEAGKFRLERVDFDLVTTIEEVIELLAPHAAHKGLELAVFVHRDTSTLLRGDPARLWQILMNLVNNALKFTETGEVVLRVNTVWEEDGQVVVRFEIEDTGVGISEEQQARLFRPFSQLDGSSTRRHGGSGLGLVISRELVGLMGGKIGVVSEPGRGSTFWFTAKFEKRTDARPMETDLSGKTVLIVDDNLTNLRILKHQLEAWEMEVAVAHNAEEALTFLAKAHFDVAILDMQMPDMDGLQLTQHIRSSAALKEMRLILMTSVDQTQAQEHLKSLGLDANLRKPVTRTQLNNCLSRVLGRAAVESRPRSWKKHSFSTEQEHDTSKLDLSGVKVLLVEDNPINRRVTSLQMEKLGVKPDLASSGLQAVELFKKTRHDIILMDCQMPEMDGFETTREIRRLGEKLGQPVILALTANVMEGDRQNCIDAGMDDYLGKPLAFPQLSATLRKWTRSSR